MGQKNKTEDEILDEELENWKNDRKESKEDVEYYNYSIASDLLNGKMGKEINDFLDTERDKQLNPQKYKKNFIQRFFDMLFKTI